MARGVRTPVREATREVVGRNGEILARRKISENPFDVPERFKDPNWDMQWVRTECYGKSDPANVANYQDTGWRPVPASRMPGYLGAKEDSDASIEYGGLMLMERPMVLTEEAREEARAEASRQVLQQQQHFRLSSDALPKGFDQAGATVKRGRAVPTDPSLRPELKRQGGIPID